MKIMLIFPPQAQPFLPHLGLPALQAFIKEHSQHEVRLLDANLEAYEYFLSRDFLKGQDAIFIDRLDAAKGMLRDDKEEYEPSGYYDAVANIATALEGISKKYPGASLDLKDFRMSHHLSSSEQIIRATRDFSENPYIEFFQMRIIPPILDFRPDIAGISISWPSQLIPGFTLSRLLKAALPGLHVSIGGSMITHLGDLLSHKRKFFALCDSFILYEGEIPLLELANALEKGKRLDLVPGLVYPEGKKNVCCNEMKIPDTLRELPCPDFDGFELSRYFSPKPYLPIAASRGCYWGRCAFCGHSFSLSKYRQRPVSMLRSDLLHLQDTKNTHHFYFVDDAMPPIVIEQLPGLIYDQGLYWGGEARFERRLLEADFHSIHRGGCRFLLWGLESYCQRVLDSMRKGVKIEIVPGLLRNSHEAGIINWVFLFLGFPGESREEAECTLDFLGAHKELIDMIAAGRFVLTRHSPVHEDAGQYGLKKVESATMEYDLLTSYRYLSDGGLTPDEIADLLDNAKSRPEFLKFLRSFVAEVHLMFLNKSHFASPYFE